MRLTRNRALRETEESVNNERQRHHHQRIQLEGRERMQMQQLITGAGRAATRALPARYHAKGTLGKPLI